MKALLNWFDDRVGYRQLVHEALYENIPGGASWRYVTGSMLVFAFVTQAVTGLFLWMCYSPSATTAWESVYYIQNEMAGGWLLRGIHHFMAQAMVTLLPIHMFQVIWDKAYRAPREFNFWTGLVLMLITLGLSLTGYLLPWDQKGYWASKVATNLMTMAPAGAEVQRLAVGGSQYGHHTLTRFFALHAGVLPLLLVMGLAAHVALFRKHGITAHPSDRRPDEYFWPRQVYKDALACLILLLIVLALVTKFQFGTLFAGDRTTLGAELGPPADSAEEYKAARPEWYFLFLFQLLKYFSAKTEFLGAIVLPGVIVAFFFVMPILGRWRLGHRVNVAVFSLLLLVALGLTTAALREDHYARLAGEFQPEKYSDEQQQRIYEDKYRASEDFLAAKEQTESEYERMRELYAYHGFPPEGALQLQRRDPETMGPRLFRRLCASCHSYLPPEGVEGTRIAGPAPAADAPNGAPNLYGFASRDYTQAMLDPERIASPEFFGNTAHGRKDESGAFPSGRMVEFVHDNLKDLDAAKQAQLGDLIVALSAQAQLARQREADAEASASGQIERGLTAAADLGCLDCHQLGENGAGFGTAPDLTGWGSAEWLTGMIGEPSAERFYSYDPGNDRMPAFAKEVSAEEIRLLVEWLRQDAKVLE